MTKRQGLVLAAVQGACIVLAFLVSARVYFRLDLTKNKAYTLSAASRELYREIPEPVQITYFISSRLEEAYAAPGEIADLIREYAARSHGKIRFAQKDPVKAGIEAEMAGLGILAQQIQVVEKNEATVATVYTGVLIEYLDKRETLPVVFSLDTLEYDLTSRIRSLVRERAREIGVIVADAVKQWEQEYAYLDQELRASGYTVRVLNAGDEIPSSLPCVFVLGSALDDWALYRLDRYIRMGGRALFALDGVKVEVSGALEARAAGGDGVFALLAAYGAVVRPYLALDASALNVQFQIQTGNITTIRLVRYPEWIAVLEQNGNANHPITARFAGVDLYWPSPVELEPPEGVSAESLFTSTAQAWLQTANFVTNPEQLSLFTLEAEETAGVKTLAAVLTGVFPSAFDGREKPVREGSSETLPDMPEEGTPSRIIVVGDTDFAGALMQATRAEARNLDFLLNAADWLGSDDDIMGIRNRQSGTGRLDKIQDAARKEALMNFSRNLNVFVVPLLVIVAGLALSWRRRLRMRPDTGEKA